jgi:hypothetical protein
MIGPARRGSGKRFPVLYDLVGFTGSTRARQLEAFADNPPREWRGSSDKKWGR